MDKEILTTFEAARYCHVHPGTIKNWIKNENLKAFKTPGGHRRIYRHDLDQFLRENEIPIIYETKALRKRVLIVDTDYRVREKISKALLRRPDMFEVAAAADSFEGGELLVAFKPDLVILDQDLPGLNPEEIAQRIKSSPYLKEARVILLSTQPQRFKLSEQGLDLCLPKPADPEKLSQETERLLSARKPKQ